MGLLFYSESINLRDELNVFIPASLRMDILKEYHDNHIKRDAQNLLED